ncbi:choice-of-anchor D domain-containing protein, partial [bacterium]|nr:choice-of-anchor D domain-containing protein [bacterium]
LLPEIEETTLVFPSENSDVLIAPAPTNITWQTSEITDDAGGTDLTISKIFVLNAETSNEVAIVTNNIPNSLGEISWIVPESLISSDNNYVLKFEVIDSVSMTNSRIFWENDFTVGLPEINLKGKDTDISNGDSSPNLADGTDFGEVVFDFEIITNTFTIENNGTVNLNISNLFFTFSSPEFSFAAMPELVIAPGTSTIFKIAFAPTNEGVFFNFVNIENDDSDKDPYTFAIKAEGVPEGGFYLLFIIGNFFFIFLRKNKK